MPELPPIERPTTLDEAWAIIQRLMAELAAAQARIAELEERLRTNSRNSSKPPSSDPPWQRTSGGDVRKPSGRKRGGQPGHEGHRRELLAAEKADQVFDCLPPERCRCGGVVVAEGEPYRRQVVEIPPMVPHVTELCVHHGRCRDCGARYRGEEPVGAPPGVLGPRATALATFLLVDCQLSRRLVQSIFEQAFGVTVSLGAFSNAEVRTSDAVAGPVAQAAEAVKDAPVAHVDETGWRQGRTRRWLWTAVSTLATVFFLRRSRGADVAKEILGTDFVGYLVSDRWSGYNGFGRRQVCWAHLLRDFQKMAERHGPSREIGTDLATRGRELFDSWRTFRSGAIDRPQLLQDTSAVRQAILDTLARGSTCSHPKTARTCANLLALRGSLFTFLETDGVEPTNNRAERAIRSPVLWRKRTHGTQSERGDRFAERLLTVVATCKQRGLNVIDYLTHAIDAAFRHETPPSLLPPPLSSA